MSTRAAAWLAWSLWALYLVLAALLLVLRTLNDLADGSSSALAVLVSQLPEGLLVLLVMMTVGALIASRRPENAIGWLFCCVALASEVGALAIEYAVRALVIVRGSLPAGTWAGLFGEAARSVGWYLLLTFLLLLFPTGKLLTPRWRPVAWFSAASVGLYCVVSVIVPDAFANTDVRLQNVPNPIAIPRNLVIGGPLEGGSILLAFAATIACGASIVVRFRRAHGAERQQLKWFAYTVVCGLVLFAVVVVSTFLLAPQDQNALGYAFDLILIALPVVTGIAILRYRLFDIDVIIRRTLIYGSLTMVLAAVYFAVVLLTQALSERLSGDTRPPAWLIVGTTLLIAALFNPLRWRVQRTIDLRFYRTRYNAARTVEAFAATLRTDLDMGELQDHLVGVVEETMRPSHVALWLPDRPLRHVVHPSPEGVVE